METYSLCHDYWQTKVRLSRGTHTRPYGRGFHAGSGCVLASLLEKLIAVFLASSVNAAAAFMSKLFLGTELRRLFLPVLRTCLTTVAVMLDTLVGFNRHWRSGIQVAADNVVTTTRKIRNTSTAKHHDGVFL